MHTLRVFLAVFGGFLAVGGLSFRIGKGLYAISKWVERKTGSSSLAYDGVPILFAVLAMSVVLTAAIVSRSASAAR
jgi:predicted transporter